MRYRFWKGRKFEIYGRRFAQKYLLGIGEFVGKEKIWVALSHGLFSQAVPKFKVKGSYIYGTECEFRPKGSDGEPEETEIHVS